MIEVKMTRFPSDADWFEVKRRAFETEGKIATTAPSEEWKCRILRARHSPIRFLQFSFDLTVPYWVSVHLCRHHVGIQPYVQSQRNDRQSEYDRNKAPQDAPVNMIIDCNAEALITLANKRLCFKASDETHRVVEKMRALALQTNPEFRHELVPMCVREGGRCNEMKPCGRVRKNDTDSV